jgi:hypothetical protein
LQDVWTAMHNDKDFVGKYLKPLYIGEVQDYNAVRFFSYFDKFSIEST